MFQPFWSCVLAMLGALSLHTQGIHSQCWESNTCRDLTTEAGILECIKACKTDLTAESPVYPGNGHMQPLSENIRKYVMSHFRWNKFGRRNSSSTSTGTSSSGSKREDASNYPFFNFFPISESQSSEKHENSKEADALERQESKRSYSMEHFRWGKPVGKKRRPIKIYTNGVEEESSESYPQDYRRDLSEELDYPSFSSQEDLENNELMGLAEKKDGNYMMHHFRWGKPPKDKRYGGFMTPERSQTPLMTLFKNAIIKNAHKKGQ
ncbi:pro-opiomelanocortin [Microcaecilia unicolor]|uniref:Pro-opiomelanocortin n=1 Tax=Microcaecilia unicolor TaxID=1415580 RepID=A0A6P7XG22_9AMPH|nr:pro-opiomelanocortin [Microcaecilia unicolor]